MKHIVIVGNGIAGITAARYIRKLSDHRITVISGETDHFFSRTALMYVYMGHMKYEHTKPYEDWFWEKNRIELRRDWVTDIDFDQKQLSLKAGKMSYDRLILAAGSRSNKFGWTGQDLEGVQGLYHYQDLELMEENTRGIKHAVVVGGGLIGIEMVEMLHSRNIHVTFLVREEHFWDMVLPQEEAQLVERHIRENGIDLRLNTQLESLLDDGRGKVKGVKTDQGEVIDCQFAGLAVGVSPNIEWLSNTPLETDKGILVDEYLRTNIPDVYAIGDCAQVRQPVANRKPIEAVWYTGRIMGETVAKTICGKETAYDPGLWFNSAKFFDIEYQVYGHIPPKAVDSQDSFYWESPDGKKCLRFAYNPDNQEVTGIHVLGMRLRQEVCERWIRKKKTLRTVVQNLRDACFDPEFYRLYDPEIQLAYNRRFTNEPVKVRKRSLLEKLLY